MGTKSKTKTIIYWVLFIIMLAGAVTCFVFSNEIFGAESVFKTTELANPALRYLYSTGIPALIRSIQIIVIAMALNHLIKLIAKITFHS